MDSISSFVEDNFQNTDCGTCSLIWKAGLVFGTIKLLIFMHALVSFIVRHLFRGKSDLLTKYGKDSWVVVTGASDGIGAEYCRQLAKLGFNIALVSRTMSKLQAVE